MAGGRGVRVPAAGAGEGLRRLHVLTRTGRRLGWRPSLFASGLYSLDVLIIICPLLPSPLCLLQRFYFLGKPGRVGYFSPGTNLNPAVGRQGTRTTFEVGPGTPRGLGDRSRSFRPVAAGRLLNH